MRLRRACRAVCRRGTVDWASRAERLERREVGTFERDAWRYHLAQRAVTRSAHLVKKCER